MTPPRVPLFGFPDVFIHAEESAVKGHPQFRSAKAGNLAAADRLVAAFEESDCVARIGALLDRRTVELVSRGLDRQTLLGEAGTG